MWYDDKKNKNEIGIDFTLAMIAFILSLAAVFITVINVQTVENRIEHAVNKHKITVTNDLIDTITFVHGDTTTTLVYHYNSDSTINKLIRTDSWYEK